MKTRRLLPVAGILASDLRAVLVLVVFTAYVVVACAVFFAMAAPARAEVPWSVEKLGPGLLASGVDIDGTRVVWAARESPAAWPAVYLYDASTGKTTTVAGGAPPLSCLGTQVEGDWVVWAVYEFMGRGAEIYAYQISTGQTRRITNNGLSDISPYLAGGRVVWVQEELTDSELYVHHLGGNVTNRVTNNLDSYYVPRMDGPWIVSQGSWGGGWDAEIKVNNLDTAFAGLVTNNYLQDTNAKVSGDWVTWQQTGVQSAEIMLYNLVTRQTRQLTSNTWSDFSPMIDAGRVAWVGGSSEPLGDNREIYLYDVNTQKTKELTHDVATQGPPVIEGDEVVWSTYTGGVYHHRVSTGITSKVADAPQQVVSLAVSGGRIAYIAGDDVYLASPASVKPPGWPPVRPPGTMVRNFWDVPAGNHYFAAIMGLRGVGAVSGFGDNTYRPDDTLKRAQFAKMIVEALSLTDSKGKPVDESMVAPFSDLGLDDPLSLYPHDYIAVIADAGVTLGKTATHFAPWDEVTRAQVVTMVVRAVQKQAPELLGMPPAGYQSALGDFSPTHGASLRVAEFNGLTANLTGYGPMWDAWAPATRAECAQIIWNLFP